MSCKNKDGKNKNKAKNIVCKTCKCEKDDNNKLKVICTDCENCDDVTIICESINCKNEENGEKNICLKDCTCNDENDSIIYITCTNYEEDLD